MPDNIYIHYGNDHFDPQKFKSISNRPMWVKPIGGLWASPIDTDMGWKDWCEGENFHIEALEKSFKFTLSESANVVRINSVKEFKDMNLSTLNDDWKKFNQIHLNFEQLLADGIDAIQLNLSKDDTVDWSEGLYYLFYGWDCDSIVIMNPDIIEPIDITLNKE